VRTTSHIRVGGGAEVSVAGRVEVRRALGRALGPTLTFNARTPTVECYLAVVGCKIL